MNIPAELVMIANECDLQGLNKEADILTDVARKLLDKQDASRMNNDWQISAEEQNARNQAFISPQYRNPQENESDFTDFMGR